MIFQRVNARSKGLAAALIAFVLVAPATAGAESAFELPYPDRFGRIPASTFDTGQHRVGNANLVIEKLDDGKVRLLSESGVDGGARNVASAVLAPIEGGNKLRILSQSSRSFDRTGAALGVLEIDHVAGSGSCTRAAREGKPEQVSLVELPHPDRVVNVPLNLVFDRLVRGEASELDFQVLLCKGGPRLMDFHANAVRQAPEQEGEPELVEVRYAPDLGSIVSFLAQAVVPKLSFWFDPKLPSRWLAHRMPLYSDGPEVLVVRQGFPTRLLFD
jgi:hypothetical protein